MRVSETGEFAFINSIAGVVTRPPESVLVGIGDDAAVWHSPVQPTIATTDTLLQDIHFDLRFITWYELGWKALAVNVSDIAAMGGIPQYALITLGLPKHTEVAAAQEIYCGITALGDKFGISVVGGDMVHSPHGLLVSVSLVGRALNQAPTNQIGPAAVLLRTAARPGDLVAVTGTLGSSAAGLALLRSGQPLAPAIETILRMAHTKPCPRVNEGQIMLCGGVKAAMDISDGTASDLAKMCQASGVGARLWLDKLPIRPEVKDAFPDRYQQLALFGGEDYELLFTAPAAILQPVSERVTNDTGTPITIIGEITKHNVGSVWLVDQNGSERLAETGGYDHFITGT